MPYQTRIEKIEESLVTPTKIEQLIKHPVITKGAELLQAGEVVAFPTETVYGLGANAADSNSVKKIFMAKGRPQDNPLIVHIASLDQLAELIEGEITDSGAKLISSFWPGPLTVILPKSALIPETTTAGLNSIAIRMPSHPVARALIKASSLPIAAPSANLSGRPSPTLAAHVFNDLQGKIPLIIDGGSAQVGLESTVVDIRKQIPVILRPGGISREEIEGVLGFKLNTADITRPVAGTPVSPGMKYRHYSPRTPLILFEGEDQAELRDLINTYSDRKLGLLLTKETAAKLNQLTSSIKMMIMGSQLEPAIIAHRLFGLLRQLDQENLDLVIIEAIPEKGIGAAIMNRLYKASSQIK